LTDTADSIEISVGRTSRDDLTISHQILASLGTDTSAFCIAIDLISSTNRDLPKHTSPLPISAITTYADTFDTIVLLVTTTLLALFIDHIIPSDADTQSIVVIRVGATVEVDT